MNEAGPTTAVRDAPDGSVEPTPSGRFVAGCARHEFWLWSALVLVPFAVLLVKLVTDGPYANWGDNALTEMQVRDVPRLLVGPYSRFGFHHPGPMFAWLLAVPYRLLGSDVRGLNLGALVINGAAVVGTGWVAWRRGGRLLLLATYLGLALLLRQVGADFVRQPWNPYATVLPFALFLFLMWELSRARRWALPAGVVVGSFLVQSHVAYGPAVGVLAIGAVAMAFPVERTRWREHGGDARRAFLRTVALAAAVGLVLWLPPLVDQVVNRPGNLREVLTFQRESHPGHPAHTIGEGAALVGRQIGSFPAWLAGGDLGGDGTFSGASVPALVGAEAFVAAAVVAWRRRAWDALRFGVLTVLSLAVGAIAVSRIIDPIYEYLVRWTEIGGIAVWWFVAVVASGEPIRNERARWYRAASVVLAIALVAVVGSNTARTAQLEAPGGSKEPEVVALTDAIRSSLGGARAVALSSASSDSWATEFGVGVELERRGIDVTYEPRLAFAVGEDRAGRPPPDAVRFYFTTDPAQPVPAGATRVASAAGITVYRLPR